MVVRAKVACIDSPEVLAQARAEGKGAVSLDGRLIDIASIRQAEALVAKAEQISAKN